MFTFKDIVSDSMGVTELTPFPLPVARLRVTEHQVSGRDGVLTTTDGSYEGQEISTNVYADVLGDLRKRDRAIKWLSGYGKLVLDSAPDRYFLARVSNLITVSEFIANEAYKFPLYFKCEPFGYLFTGEKKLSITKATSLENEGTVHCLPIITVYGSGNITLQVNNQIVKLTAVDEYITMDSDLQECVKGQLERGDKMEGEFIVLEEGTNNISFTGSVTKIEITPRWRCL